MKRFFATPIPHSWAKVAARAAVLAIALGMAPALAIDLDAGDWVPPFPGHDMLVVYGQNIEERQEFANGQAVLNNADVNEYLTIARYVHPIKIGSFIVAPQALLPFATVSASGKLAPLGHRTGFGDFFMAMPIWLYANPTTRNYFAISPYVFAPTGSYDHSKPINIGENRWKFDLQSGGSVGIGKSISLEATADVMSYGNNTDFGVISTTQKQHDLYQLQGYFDYYLSPGTILSLGASHTSGGQEIIADIAQQDTTRTTKAIATVSAFFTGRDQILFSFERDLQNDNGLKMDSRFDVRYFHIF